ncbi:putative histidine kinase HHK12p [Viridothelium virens]|uniref:Putative histidine kinase HHK12p n=1 Tax=Viridothelium virens TaxID=1048519 RepID=A0A6A6HA62_VIRVR|nr:putative histidine kinase HHK12p [Viridothelium virens]
MENLDKLTNAGVSIYDLNNEYLEKTDWSKSPLDARSTWPVALRCYVQLISTLPQPAAIFWGESLTTIQNIAWTKATGENDESQGADAADCLSGEALGSLWSSVRGRTVKVAGKSFLPNIPQYDAEAPILLSTLLDEKDSRQGVLAQLIHTPRSETTLDAEFLETLGGGAKELKPNKLSDESTGSSRNGRDAKQTELFQKFAEILPNGLAILDSEAEAVFVNDGFFKLTTNRSEQSFRAWPESIDPRDYDRVMTAYRDAFSSRQELRVEFRCATHDEEQELWRLFLLRPLKEETDAGFICAVIDITELKLAEITQEKAAIEARDRKDQQERFIDMVSHEIRNPLSAVLHLTDEIKATTNLLKAKRDDELLDELADAADTILLCVQHQNVLVDDILSFSKLDAMMLTLAPSVVQPKWEFSLALKVFQSELKSKNIGFHYALDVSYEQSRVDYVVADLNRMKQVLINLVTNAIKFTANKKGTKRISVAMGATTERPTSYPPNVVFFETKENQFHYDSTMSADWGQGSAMYLMVAIKDTGIGIGEEDQMKLFERFRQATPKTSEKYGGSGLGLFISRKICQLHGGDIGVSSREGEGSTFAFFFKVRRASPGDTQRPPSNRQGSSQSSVPQAAISKPDSEQLRPDNAKANGDKQKARPPLDQSLSDHPGIGSTPEVPSLDEPPVEMRDEAHPSSSSDDRYKQTADIAHDIPETRASSVKGLQNTLPDSLVEGQGETNRQADSAGKTSEKLQQTQDAQREDVLPTVLLVEDNLINQKVLRRQLQHRGFQVSVAKNGQEAIDAVKQKIEANSSNSRERAFDCILMDQEMPIKDGNTATVEIRDFEAARKVTHGVILGVTANVREVQRHSMLEAGMDDVISKPYKVDQLVDQLKNLLSLK